MIIAAAPACVKLPRAFSEFIPGGKFKNKYSRLILNKLQKTEECVLSRPLKMIGLLIVKQSCQQIICIANPNDPERGLSIKNHNLSPAANSKKQQYAGTSSERGSARRCDTHRLALATSAA